LKFWKKQAVTYKRFHYYTIWWTIPSAVVIPFLAQAVTQDPFSKWLITLISSHTAILLSLHKALKVERNYKAFRQGESEFYDLYRRLLDRPSAFGETEEEQLNNYFDAVENVRKYVRNAEVDNFPAVEQVKSQLSNEVSTPTGQNNKGTA
jgi:CRISPR/Cas system-associated protein Csm6